MGLVAFVVNGFLEYQFWNQSLTVLVVLMLAYAVALGDSAAEPSPASPTMAAEAS